MLVLSVGMVCLFMLLGGGDCLCFCWDVFFFTFHAAICHTNCIHTIYLERMWAGLIFASLPARQPRASRRGPGAPMR